MWEDIYQWERERQDASKDVIVLFPGQILGISACYFSNWLFLRLRPRTRTSDIWPLLIFSMSSKRITSSWTVIQNARFHRLFFSSLMMRLETSQGWLWNGLQSPFCFGTLSVLYSPSVVQMNVGNNESDSESCGLMGFTHAWFLTQTWSLQKNYIHSRHFVPKCWGYLGNCNELRHWLDLYCMQPGTIGEEGQWG